MSVVNVWASWCVPCHDKAPLLAELAKDKRVADGVEVSLMSPPLRHVQIARDAALLELAQAPHLAPMSNATQAIRIATTSATVR